MNRRLLASSDSLFIFIVIVGEGVLLSAQDFRMLILLCKSKYKSSMYSLQRILSNFSLVPCRSKFTKNFVFDSVNSVGSLCFVIQARLA